MGEYRAYEVLTDWSGPVRDDAESAWLDAEERNRAIGARGGTPSAVAARRDGYRLVYADSGSPIWPPSGRANGAARWR